VVRKISDVLTLEAGWGKGGVGSDVVTVVTRAVQLSVAFVDRATIFGTPLEVAALVVESVNRVSVEGPANDRTWRPGLGELGGHAVVIADGSAVGVDPPAATGVSKLHTHLLEQTQWWDVVMILSLRIGVAVAAVIGPSLLVTIQQNAVAENTYHVAFNLLGSIRRPRFSRDSHGVVLIFGGIV